MHLAWILIQHSDEDPEFRASLVPTLIERFNAGDMSPDDIARVIEPISAQSLLDSAILDPARHRHSGMTSSLECLLQCFGIGDRFGAHIVQGKPFRKHARKSSEVMIALPRARLQPTQPLAAECAGRPRNGRPAFLTPFPRLDPSHRPPATADR